MLASEMPSGDRYKLDSNLIIISISEGVSFTVCTFIVVVVNIVVAVVAGCDETTRGITGADGVSVGGFDVNSDDDGSC
ncbi:Hypothetical predicted protein [Octopus vulgaris]|uniref:Uncharacterized protein n=1 Tax=Octopus vulgaris TaxID=6645 RepID=A0AA36AFN3_OCTVU|nr:Hypothetical predicted protein [Octopus vulgaris]